MWIAHEGGAGGVGPDPQNIKLAPMQAFDFATFNGFSSMRFWPKMACDEHGDNCGLGGSGGPGQACVIGSGPDADYSHCAPPLDTKFEGTFGQVGVTCNPEIPSSLAACDYVDISLVDGYTLPFKLEIHGHCTNSQDGRVVNVIDCSGLTLDRCPAVDTFGPVQKNLKAINPHTGLVSGCYGPCMKLIDPKWNNTAASGHHAIEPDIAPFCCTTPPLTPEQCASGPVKDTAYVNGVHAMCPGVYGFSYDDGMGLMRCQAGTQYDLTFSCPSVRPKQPGNVKNVDLPTCRVGAKVKCPGSNAECFGKQCCPDGSICPSAPKGWKMCEKPKKFDCTTLQRHGPVRPAASLAQKLPAKKAEKMPPPAKAAARPRVDGHGSKQKPALRTPPAMRPLCRIGSKVTCPGTGAICTGNQCCPDHSTCPSAAPDFKGCAHGKTATCALPASNAKHAAHYCKLGQKVQCPGVPGTCTGNQCCSDGFTCPSAGNDFVKVCKFGKKVDCLEPGSVVELVRRFDAEDKVSAVDDHDYSDGLFFRAPTSAWPGMLLVSIIAISAAVFASARLRQYQLLPVEVVFAAPIGPSSS